MDAKTSKPSKTAQENSKYPEHNLECFVEYTNDQDYTKHEDGVLNPELKAKFSPQSSVPNFIDKSKMPKCPS